MRKKSVRTTFIKLMLFGAGFIILHSAYEVAARKIYLHRTNLDVQIKAFADELNEIEIIFLGNSHIHKGINPQYFQRKAFNLAFNAQDLYYDTQLLNRYVAHMPRLKAVVFGLDYFTFGYDESDLYPHLVREYYDSARIKPRAGLDLSFFTYYSLLFLHKETFVGDILTGKRKGFLYSLEDDTVSSTLVASDIKEALLGSGYLFSRGGMNNAELMENGRQRAKFHYTQCFRNGNVTSIYQLLSESIHKLRAQGIKVFLIIPPYTRSYREGFPAEFIDGFQQKIEELLHSHPGISFFDYSSGLPLEPHHFLDSDHLNFQGAEVFSRILSDRLENILNQTP